MKRLVAATLDRFGQIDVLVNNAALYAPLHEQKFTEIDVDLWDKVMAVNLRGPFLMAKHVAPEMAKRKYGKIINIGSGTAVRGIPWIMHYATSKGGIIAMTRSMSREPASGPAMSGASSSSIEDIAGRRASERSRLRLRLVRIV